MKKYLTIFVLLTLVSIMLAACNSNAPYIGENGNWWIGESDLEIPAQGPQGEPGQKGEKGDQGDTGIPGTPGTSVTVQSVQKTKTEASIDTYTIFFSDGTQSNFTVTNGNDGQSVYITSVEKEDSDGLTDSYKILFSDDTVQRFSVTNGQSITIQSIGKTGTQGLVDTYQINFSDGKSLSFTVTNGADGLTPYIGANGNWWIGNEDTGTHAEIENMDRAGTDGLLFRMTIRGGVAGYEVYDYTGTETDIVIPNMIFNQPVVSIASSDALSSDITSLSISSNTQYLPSFSGKTNLVTFDFNHAPISALPAEMFENCSSLQHIDNYENVAVISTEAFRSTALQEFDFSNIQTIGNYAFYDCRLCDDDWRLIYGDQYFEFIPGTVLEIGSHAFDDDFPVYYENVNAPKFTSDGLFVGVKHSTDGYYYQDNGDFVSVLNYDGDQTRIRIPSTIDGKPVKAIAGAAFMGNHQMERIEIPSSVTQIGAGCFSYCKKLNSVFVPDSVSSFGRYEFDDDAWWEKTVFFFEANTIDYTGGITSPENLNIKKYMLSVAPADIDDDDFCVYYKKATSYEVVSIKNVAGVVTIPSVHNALPVSKINTFALYGETWTRGINIENGIPKIATNAFSSSDLLFINVPSSVEIVNYRGFNSLYDCTVYIEAAVIPTDWDSSWYNSIGGYKLNAKAQYSIDGSFLYKIMDEKLYLVKYLNAINLSVPVIIPETVDEIPVYGICSECFYGTYGTQSNSSYNRYIFVIPDSITVMESNAIYLPGYGYSALYMGIESSDQIPAGWNTNWFYTSYNYRYNSGYNKVYYSDSWTFVDGIPVANN